MEVRGEAVDDQVVVKMLLLVIELFMVEFGYCTEGDRTTEGGTAEADSEDPIEKALEVATIVEDVFGANVVCGKYELVVAVMGPMEGLTSDTILMKTEAAEASTEELLDPLCAITVDTSPTMKASRRSCCLKDILTICACYAADDAMYLTHRYLLCR